ncbi:MAG: glutamate--tRNA ligase [Prevotellaceae bacterium]|jgi:glutamyl-tRNA synthetase|nr:glutamate--tRNA ligase [Prevotellaceae bacterium]
MERIRVRFAPSPTGALHIGGVRTALFNYLFARKNAGDFILRIEDTDSSRYVEGAEQYIINALKWCGLKFDEGAGIGGPHSPYRQSERKHIYQQYAEQLVDDGFAYYAFDTSEELENARTAGDANGNTFVYNYTTRNSMKNSLSLPAHEVQQYKLQTNNWVIRFRIPVDTTVSVDDLVRGNVSVNTSVLDDKVLWKKNDELPTYHLANIVDDKLMEITHVIRGEEWLPSLPLHILIYNAFKWKQPQFAHLPLLLKPDGKGKLSKRDGDKLGFPVFPLKWTAPDGEISRGYREDGYFPEALINFLALLGWNAGTEQELFSMDELIRQFDLERVVKSGAKFNIDKAKWFNQQYLKTKKNEELAALYMPVLQEKGLNPPPRYVAKVCGLIKERAVFVSDFWDLSYYFFMTPENYDDKAVKKYCNDTSSDILTSISDILSGISDFSAEKTEQAIHSWIELQGMKTGAVMNLFRLAIVGASIGPSMFDIITLIGKKETLFRLETFLWFIQH